MGFGYTLGALIYIAAVILPGYGLSELTGRWGQGDGLALRIGEAICFGLAVDTVVLSLSTLGMRIGGLTFAGLGTPSIAFTIGLGVAFTGVSVYKRKGVTKLPEISKTDVMILALSGAVGGFVVIYFMNYPLFPIYYSKDYAAIVAQSAGLVNGNVVTLPKMFLYGAGYFQVALFFVATGQESFQSATIAMSLVVLGSPFVVYAVVSKLFRNGRAALIATGIFTLSGTLWAQMVFVDGLYPNFVGLLLELALVLVFLETSTNFKSPLTWSTTFFVLFAAYFSHFTALALLGSLLVVAGIEVVRRVPRSLYTLGTAAVFVAPGLIGFLAFPKSFRTILLISYLSGSPQPLTTPLSSALASVPSLAYLAFDVRNDIGFLATMMLLGLSLYRGYTAGDSKVLIPLVWFFGLLVASPQNYAAWRFELEAVLPLTLLAGYGLDAIIPQQKISKVKKLRKGDPYPFGAVVLTLLFMTPIVAGGWGSTVAQGLVLNNSGGAGAQVQVNSAMTWLTTNTPPRSSLLVITDPIFIYSNVIIHRNCTFAYIGNSSEAGIFARQIGADYVIVTRHDVFYSLLSEAANDSSPNLPWYTYRPSPSMQLVYNSTDVRVFYVGASA